MVIIAPSLNSLHADAVNNSTFPSKTKKCWKQRHKQINDCQYNSNSFENMFKLTIVESDFACFFLAPGSIRTNPLLLPLVHGYNKYSTWFCFRSFSEPGYRISIERKEHRIECQYTNKQKTFRNIIPMPINRLNFGCDLCSWIRPLIQLMSVIFF